MPGTGTGKGKGANGKVFRLAEQEKGISEPGLIGGVPSRPNPRTKTEPGLGGATLPHPYQAGKKPI